MARASEVDYKVGRPHVFLLMNYPQMYTSFINQITQGEKRKTRGP